MKTLDTIVADIYELFNPEKTHTVNEENLNAFLENVGQLVRTRLEARENLRDPLRFSALGKPDRQLWYMAHDYPTEEMNSQTYLKFMYGDIIEQMVVFLAKEAGHDVRDEQLEVEVDGVKGHIDCIIDGVVVDVKSAAPYSYEKFVNQSLYEDVFGSQYIAQLCGYSNVLTPGEAPAFLAFDKVSGKMHVMNVSASIAKDYQPRERILHLKAVIDSPTPPERCYEDEPDGKSGNRKLTTGCSYCGFKHSCWDGLRGFAYSNGPRFLTHVERVPDVPEIT